MSIVVTVGHTTALAVIYLDQHGNPMLVNPTADSITWSNTTPAAETLVQNADGTATATAVAPGVDEIDLAVVVAGLTFNATLAVEVDAEPQVLTSVSIEATVS